MRLPNNTEELLMCIFLCVAGTGTTIIAGMMFALAFRVGLK